MVKSRLQNRPGKYERAYCKQGYDHDQYRRQRNPAVPPKIHKPRFRHSFYFCKNHNFIIILNSNMVSSAFIISYYFAFFHSHHSSAEGIHHIFVVRRQDNRRAQFIYFLKNTYHFSGAYRVKVARRLVRHHQVRPVYYRSGNGHVFAVLRRKARREILSPCPPKPTRSST